MLIFLIRLGFCGFYYIPAILVYEAYGEFSKRSTLSAINPVENSTGYLGLLAAVLIFFIVRYAIKNFEFDKHAAMLYVNEMTRGLDGPTVGRVISVEETADGKEYGVEYEGSILKVRNPFVSRTCSVGSIVMIYYKKVDKSKVFVCDDSAYVGEDPLYAPEDILKIKYMKLTGRIG